MRMKSHQGMFGRGEQFVVGERFRYTSAIGEEIGAVAGIGERECVASASGVGDIECGGVV
jgi:hypothetical protein